MPGSAASEVKALLHTVLAAALLFALWIALTDTTRLWEMVTGAVCAVLAAAGAEVARRAGRVDPTIEARWLRHLPRVALWIVRDSVIVLRAALAPTAPRGRMRAVPFTPGSEGRLAFAAGVGSAGPNQYVVAEDDAAGVLLVHELVAADSVSALDVVDAR